MPIMEIRRAKMFSLLSFAYLCISLCVSVNPHKPGAFFTVGSGFDEDSHFLELSSTWPFNPRWSSGKPADVESRPPEDPVIRMFGEEDEHIDLQLPSQRFNAEEASSFVRMPALGSYPPLPPPCLSLPCPFPSSLSSSPLPASLSPELSPWFTPSYSPSFPPPMPPPLPVPSSPPFSHAPNPSAPFSPPLPAPVPDLPSPSSTPPQSSSPVSPSPTHPISPPSISPSPSSPSPSAPSISPTPTSPSSSSAPSPFVSPSQIFPPSPSPSFSTSPTPTHYPIFTPSPSPSPSESTSPSPFPIFTPAPTSLSPSVSPSSSPSSIFPPSPTPSPFVSPPPSPAPSSPVPSPNLYPIFPPSPFPSPMESPSPAPSPIFPPAPTSLSPVSSPTPSPQSLPQPSPTPSPSPIPSPVPIPPQIAMLANLSISNGAKLVPQFNPYIFNYTASMGSKVRRFHVIAFLPEDKEDYSLYIDSIPLKTGKKSPPLRLGKKGETVTFHIFVRAINHDPSTYALSVTREASHKGLGIVATIFVVLSCIVGAVILLVLGYATYVYVQRGRMPRLSDFQHPKERESLYTPLITAQASSAVCRL